MSSLKLALILLALSIVLIIPATLVQQGLSLEHYTQLYGPTLAYLVMGLRYNLFFSSPMFLALVGTFWLNLLACTAKRFVRQLRQRTQGRYGPDILHLGLLVLVLVGLVSSAARQEGLLYLKTGQGLSLPDNTVFLLDEFVFERYPDNRPKRWASVFSIIGRDGQKLASGTVEVNKPLRVAGLVLYQASYRTDPATREAESGIMLVRDNTRWFYLFAFAVISVGLMLSLVDRLKALVRPEEGTNP